MKTLRLTIATALALLAAPVQAATGPPPVVDREISFRAEDGVDIRGVVSVPEDAWTSGTKPPCVVLLHRFGRARDSLLPIADELVRAGLAVARIDLRGHGKSTTRNNEFRYLFPPFPREEFALSGADTVLLARELASAEGIDAGRLALLGVGEGSLTAVEAAARVPAIRALVIVDPPESAAGFVPAPGLGAYGRRPALLVASSHQRSIDAVEALAQFGAGPRETLVADDFGIGERLLLEDSPATPQVVRWLAAQLASE